MKRATLFSVLICLTLSAAAAATLLRRAERGIERLDLSRVNTARIDHVQITGDSAMELFKDGAAWRTAAGRSVDPDAIDGLLRGVAGLKSSDMVVQDEAAQEAVGLTGNTSTRVRLLQETRVLADFVVGRADMMTAWIRESERSFKVANVSDGVFRRPPQMWLQRRLLTAAADDVAAVSVHLKGQPSYSLVPAEGGFGVADASVLPKDFRFDYQDAKRLVETLADVRADTIVETPPASSEATGLSAPEAKLRLTWTEAAAAQRGQSHAELWVGKTTSEARSFAQLQGSSDVVTLPSYVVQTLARPPDSFRDTTLMAKFDLEQVTSFTVRDGKKSMTVKRDGPEAWVVAGADKSQNAAARLDRGKVLGRLRQVMGVHGTAVAKTSVARAGFGKAGGDITVVLADASRRVLRLGDESRSALGEPAGYYAQGTADPQLYVLQRGIRNSLLAMADSLKSTATNQGLSALDPGALQNLPAEVRRAVQAQMAKEAAGQPAH